VIDFQNKTLDSTEQNCVNECIHHLSEPPRSYQSSQQFHGFLSSEEIQMIKARNALKAKSLI
jgi:hypothetical protein